MIFAATTFFHLVNLKELPTILTAFLTFQLDSGMHCRTFFRASFFFFFFRLKTKIQGRVVKKKKQGKDKPGLERNLNSDMRA